MTGSTSTYTPLEMASAISGIQTGTGGYYTPSVSQPDENTMQVAFTASEADMPDVETVMVKLPQGTDGQDGITPTIGANGNWYIGDTDTGKPSRGATGATGATGPAGPAGATGATGSPGKDGYTPVKGTDYWTEEDKAEIVADVLAALPDGDEVTYG